MFAGSLLCALDHSELRLCREFSRMNDIMKPRAYCKMRNFAKKLLSTILYKHNANDG